MPPKRKQSTAGLSVDTTVTPRSDSSVLSNKSGTPTEILKQSPTGYDPKYQMSQAYKAGDDTVIDARQPATWITNWMMLTTAIVFWDCSYILLRPWSMQKDNASHYIWYPYHEIYGNVDHWYGPVGYEAYTTGKEGWNISQSVFNAIEIVFQLIYLYMNSVRDPGATVVALIVSVSTFVKTCLYFLVMLNGTPTDTVPSFACLSTWDREQCTTFVLSYLIPNGVWIVVPLLVIYNLGSQLARANAIAAPKRF